MPLVLWQTVKGPVEVVQADEINAAIRELVSSRENTAVADWAGSVKDEELSYDGVHPALGHEDAMARIVAPMLRQWWSAVTSEEAAKAAPAEQCQRRLGLRARPPDKNRMIAPSAKTP